MWWLTIHKRLLDDAVEGFGCLIGALVYVAASVVGALLLAGVLLGHGAVRVIAVLLIAAAVISVVYDELTS
jgi:hypothetical protein